MSGRMNRAWASAALAVLACAGCGGVHPSPVRDASAWAARLARVEARNMHSAAPTGRLESASAGFAQGRGFSADSDVLVRSEASAPVMLAAFEPEPAGDSRRQVANEAEYRFGRGPLPSLRDTIARDLKALPASMWEDTKRVYTDPVNLVLLLGAGGASAAVRYSGVDDHFEDTLDERYDAFSEGFNDALSIVGNPGTHFALAGLWYLIGQQRQDDKTYEVGRTLFNTLVINGATTMLLKVAANTESPNGESLAWPSGHASSSFAVAAVMHQAYGPWVGIPLYALAGLVCFERMDDQEHNFSDVVFGAALGLIVGHTVAAGHRPEIFGGEIVPYVSSDGRSSGIAWVFWPDRQRRGGRADRAAGASRW